MKAVQDYLVKKQSELSEHPFFLHMKPEPELEKALFFAAPAAFWVLAFQDVLRLNVERFEDPALRAQFEAHRQDDRHDGWFLNDLAKVGDKRVENIAWLFGAENELVRDATYAVVSEVFRATDDRLRIVLVLSLEATGHVSFGRAIANIEESGHGDELTFFGRKHLEVEEEHEIFDEEVHKKTLEMELPAELRAEAFALVDRVFAAFWKMMTGIDRHRPSA